MQYATLSTYRRTLTSAHDEPGGVCIWAPGIVTIDGHPPIIINHVETVMIYDAATLPGEAYRIPWWEIGIFRDPVTGELPESWVNPLTGQTIEPARKFEKDPRASASAKGRGRRGNLSMRCRRLPSSKAPR